MSRTIVVVALLGAASLVPVSLQAGSTLGTWQEPPEIAVYHPGLMLRGGSTLTSKAAADTFYLYGGPGSLEGKFQTAQNAPDMQGWIGVDLTEGPRYWQVHTFNSPTGTAAAWCGQTAEQEPGWSNPPGYGNNWTQALDFRQSVVDPQQPTTVKWNFVFNHDTEPIYDFFTAAWDSAGTWIALTHLDGTNSDSTGTFVPVETTHEFVVPPGAYVRDDQVHLRFLCSSDGGWSDEDGLWPSDGAAQVDDVTVDLGVQGGTTFEDFEAGFTHWNQQLLDFSGDFSKVFPSFEDIDPCRGNTTPQVGFIDDGTPPRNAPGESTGGALSPNWNYGVPGGWVVNYQGGLWGSSYLDNQVWSPEIEYDLPGSADDNADGVLILAFDVWDHLPLCNAMFWKWSIRSFDGSEWTDWRDNNLAYFGGDRVYRRVTLDVSGKIPDYNTVQKVQIALGVDEFILFESCYDATPSPLFDNVSLAKAAAPGPKFSTRSIDLYQDSFSETGATAAEYDGPGGAFDETAFAIRVDRAAAINGAGTIPLPGDSLSVDVFTAVPGTALDGLPVLKYALFANPAFDHVRDTGVYGQALGTIDGPPSPTTWNAFTGTVTGDTTRTQTGSIIENRFAFDLPFDGPHERSLLIDDPAEPAGFYPGDWILYYVEARDTAGNLTTIPPGPGGGLEPHGFPVQSGTLVANSLYDLQDNAYDPQWRIRGLPTIWSDGSHPQILLINDAFGFGNEALWGRFHRWGFGLSEELDSFEVHGPTSGVDNGIGSQSHGATAEQLRGYDCILYDAGGLSSLLLSDGTDATAAVDRGDDQGVLAAWHAQPADRYAAWWGDYLASYLADYGPTFASDVLGVELGPGGANVRPQIGSQTAPSVAVAALPGLFDVRFVAFGGCPSVNQFDDLRPRQGAPPAIRLHEFLAPDGSAGAYEAAASVWYDRVEGGFRKVDVTFPFGFQYVRTEPDGPTNSSAALFFELLTAFGHTINPIVLTPADEAPRPLVLQEAAPNPFNPRTTIRFVLPETRQVRLRVLDVRGRVVRSLIDDRLNAGDHEIVFDGRDDRGRNLASGVYLYELIAGREQRVRKLALVR